VEYSEEILTQWHQWYSDTSDSDEEDFQSDGSRTNELACSSSIRYVSDQSSSTSTNNSSDEDYRENMGMASRNRGRTKGYGKGKKKAKPDVAQATPIAPPPLISTLPGVKEPKVIRSNPPSLTTVPPKKPSNVVLPKQASKPVPPLARGSDQPVQYYQVPLQSIPPQLVSLQVMGGAQPSFATLLTNAGGNTTNMAGLYGSGTIISPIKGTLPAKAFISNTGKGFSTGGTTTKSASSSKGSTVGSSKTGNIIFVQQQPQRVSVIMNPRNIVLAPPTSSGHLTQLDGPISKKGKKRKSPDELNEEFEKTCQQAAEKSSMKKLKRKKTSNEEDDEGQGTGTDGGSFTCPKCNRTFQSHSVLKVHMEMTHLTISTEATIAERAPHWRQIIKKHKATFCEKCLDYKAKSVAAISYHFERCGRKETLTFPCTQCDKVYTSKPGLDYHIRVIHNDDKEILAKEKDDKIKDESPLMDNTTPRKAAKKATNQIQQLVIDSDAEDPTHSNMDASNDDQSKSYDEKSLRKLFKSKSTVECPKGCGGVYKSYVGLKYHMEHGHNNVQKTYYCPHCKYIGIGEKRIMNHLQKRHSKNIDNLDDLEHVVMRPDNSNDDGGGNETKKSPKKKSPRKVISKKNAIGHDKVLSMITSDKDGSFTCPKCNRTFPSRSGLRDHMEMTHLTISTEATIAERAPHWRQIIKKHKATFCEKCLDYKAKSVAAISYHFERCGRKETLTFPCTQCDKVYTSKPGLDYHIRVIHNDDKEILAKEKDDKIKDESPLMDNTTPRKAAKKATNQIQQLVIDSDAEDPTHSNMDASNDDQSKSYDEKSLRKLFKSKSTVECPKGCGGVYKSYGGLKYHLEHGHNLKNTYHCPHCNYTGVGKKRLTIHLQKRHNKNVDNPDDLEYEVTMPDDGDGEDDDDSSGDEEDDSGTDGSEEEMITSEAKRPKTKSLHTFQIFGTANYTNMYKAVKSRIHVNSGTLYSNWKPLASDYRLITGSELDSYLPIKKESMKHSCNSDNPPLPSLPLFAYSPDEQMAYVGGPVWAMDWLPCRQGSLRSYVAMATYRSYNETHDMMDVLVHKGLIQIWSFEMIDNGEPPIASLCYCIAHNWGCIRDMKWCHQGPSSEPLTNNGGEDENILTHLGLLAVACSDGGVKILSLPDPDDLEKSFNKPTAAKPLVVAMTKVTAILKPGSSLSLDNNFGPSMCLQWSVNYDKIAAGFSNGIVAIWHLESPLLSSLLLRCPDPDPVMFPIIQLSGHKGPVRCIAWSGYDSNFMFTGGNDKRGLLWDIRQSQAPIQKTERIGIITKAIWPLVWPAVFIIEDSAANRQCTHLLTFSNAGCISMSLTRDNIPVSSFAYSDERDKLLIGNFMGDISCITMLPSVYNPLTKNRVRPSKFLLKAKLNPICIEEKQEGTDRVTYGVDEMTGVLQTYQVVFDYDNSNIQTTKQAYYSDIIPLTAVTQCLWCPDNTKWFVCTFNNGFVKFIKE
jgi:WD40 repeat protein